MTKLNLYVVRHGQTYFNIYNKLQGWSNSPLTQKGIDGAVATGKRLADVHFEAAYCSDTTRAMDTAKLILKENNASAVKEPQTTMFFREEFYGYYEGIDMAQAWYLAGAPHGLPTLRILVTISLIGKKLRIIWRKQILSTKPKTMRSQVETGGSRVWFDPKQSRFKGWGQCAVNWSR